MPKYKNTNTLRQDAFIDTLVFKYDGLEPVQAYMDIYQVSKESAQVSVSRLLSQVRIKNEIESKLRMLPRYRTEKHIFADIVALQQSAKLEGTKAKMLELQAKNKAMLIEKTVNQNENTEVNKIDLTEATQSELIEELTKRLTLSPKSISAQNEEKTRGGGYADTSPAVSRIEGKDVPTNSTVIAGGVGTEK